MTFNLTKDMAGSGSLQKLHFLSVSVGNAIPPEETSVVQYPCCAQTSRWSWVASRMARRYSWSKSDKSLPSLRGCHSSSHVAATLKTARITILFLLGWMLRFSNTSMPVGQNSTSFPCNSEVILVSSVDFLLLMEYFQGPHNIEPITFQLRCCCHQLYHRRQDL